ncbi:MAG: hypothetical protein NVS3B11_08950 [Collimonas sp.]
MPEEKIDKSIVCESEYLSLVTEFDFLWGRKTTLQEQARMERMIRLINAFEENRRAEIFPEEWPDSHANPPG